MLDAPDDLLDTLASVWLCLIIRPLMLVRSNGSCGKPYGEFAWNGSAWHSA
jgi:hypothetical protein